jgi:alanine racemase
MQYTIGEIAKIIGADIQAGESVNCTDRKINWLLTDSRSLCFPEQTLFFALKTQRNDGHKYISELYKRGVRNFVVTTTEGLTGMKDATLLLVRNSLTALQQIASAHRARFNIPIVAITGSNGKTTVKEWLYQLLSPITTYAGHHAATTRRWECPSPYGLSTNIRK